MERIMAFLEEDDSNFDAICETNNPEEQLILAKRYIEGLDGYSQDKEKGMNYLRRSMLGQNSNAMIYYSLILLQEQGQEALLQTATEGMQEMFGSNDPLFYFIQAQTMISQGETQKAFEYLDKASSLGHVQASYQLAAFYDQGSLVTVDKSKSIYYFKKAAELDHTESMYRLAYLYDIGGDIDVDKQKAAYYYKKAADKGHLCSIYKYASKLLNGEGINEDLNEAYRYYMIGDAENKNLAMFQCGWMINSGYGIKADTNEAQNLFQTIHNTKINLQDIEIPKISSKKLREICKEMDSIFNERKNKAMKNFITVCSKYDHYYGQLNSDLSFYDEVSRKFDTDNNSDNDLLILQKKYGQFIPTDAENARIYYQIAIDESINDSTDEYTKSILNNGYGIPIDLRELNDYFMKKADSGDHDAILIYANILKNQIYVLEDQNKADYYIKLASQVNDDQLIEKPNKKDKHDSFSKSKMIILMIGFFIFIIFLFKKYN